MTCPRHTKQKKPKKKCTREEKCLTIRIENNEIRCSAQQKDNEKHFCVCLRYR